MIRKVNRVGQNTLTVSLPANWVKQHDINPGDDLMLQELGKAIVITKDHFHKKGKKIVLGIDDFCKVMLNKFIQQFYLEGAEEVVLKFKKDSVPDYKNDKELLIDKHINKLVDRFIGVEIISQTKNRIVLQSLMSDEEVSKIQVIEKRVFFLIKEFLEEFITAMDGDFQKFHDRSYDYHDNISKFTYYYMRLLHFSDYSEDLKSRMSSLYVVIDKIIDKVRHTSERVSEMKKITPKTKKYVKEIFSLFLDQFDFIFKSSLTPSELKDLIGRRYGLVNKVNKSNYTEEELKVMSECKILLDTISDFMSSYVALNMESFAVQETVV